MLYLIILSLIFGIFGLFMGKILAKRGFTIDFNIEEPKYQKTILISLGLIPLIVILLLFLDKLNLINKFTFFIPQLILLYVGEYLYDLVILIGCFIAGVIIGLELFKTKKNISNTKIQLFSALLIISLTLSILVYQTLPIIGQVKEAKIIDNIIVLQTTDFTCAPASIATVGRVTGKYPDLTEKEVVKLTKTDRLGTSTLAQIKTLEKLDFNPSYKRGLNLDDLVNLNQLAILHVKEKIGTRLIGHAVVLLSVERNKDSTMIKIANPLYGIDYKSDEQMKDYWFGEGVFINYKLLFDLTSVK